MQILEEQQQKFLKAQQLIPSRSRQSTSPVSQHRKSGGRRPKSTVTEQPPDHFRILENRLKSVEAERQALLDLNSSLQDEINTLKKLALNSDTGGKQNCTLKQLRITYILYENCGQILLFSSITISQGSL